MSRIGRKPIPVPAGVEFKLDDNVVTVKGPKGTLTQKVHPNMHIALENGEIHVTRPDDEKENRASRRSWTLTASATVCRSRARSW